MISSLENRQRAKVFVDGGIESHNIWWLLSCSPPDYSGHPVQSISSRQKCKTSTGGTMVSVHPVAILTCVVFVARHIESKTVLLGLSALRPWLPQQFSIHICLLLNSVYIAYIYHRNFVLNNNLLLVGNYVISAIIMSAYLSCKYNYHRSPLFYIYPVISVIIMLHIICL